MILGISSIAYICLKYYTSHLNQDLFYFNPRFQNHHVISRLGGTTTKTMLHVSHLLKMEKGCNKRKNMRRDLSKITFKFSNVSLWESTASFSHLVTFYVLINRKNTFELDLSISIDWIRIMFKAAHMLFSRVDYTATHEIIIFLYMREINDHEEQSFCDKNNFLKLMSTLWLTQVNFTSL